MNGAVRASIPLKKQHWGDGMWLYDSGDTDQTFALMYRRANASRRGLDNAAVPCPLILRYLSRNSKHNVITVSCRLPCHAEGGAYFAQHERIGRCFDRFLSTLECSPHVIAVSYRSPCHALAELISLSPNAGGLSFFVVTFLVMAVSVKETW